jgi:hypothetical protein
LFKWNLKNKNSNFGKDKNSAIGVCGWEEKVVKKTKAG